MPDKANENILNGNCFLPIIPTSIEIKNIEKPIINPKVVVHSGKNIMSLVSIADKMKNAKEISDINKFFCMLAPTL